MTGDNRLPALADEIQAEHSAVLEASATATRHAIQAGHLLIEAKTKVPHGDWLAWLSDNCQLSERTAQRYMRLAAKVPALDPANASRVSDLPIRDALRAIADQRAELSPPEKGADWNAIWTWAGRQCSAPFNAFDLERARAKDGYHVLRNKLCKQIGIPTVVNVCLGMPEEIPALRLPSTADLFDALRRFASIANGDAECSILDIDTASLSVYDQTWLLATLGLDTEREAGRLLLELDYREKHWTAKSPEVFAKQVEQDREAIHAALKARLDASEARP